MSSCKIERTGSQVTFDKMYEDMQKDTYWIRLFCRPCCPAPDLDGAIKTLDKLACEVDSNEHLSDDEKRQLIELIESRKEWYPTSGLCRH